MMAEAHLLRLIVLCMLRVIEMMERYYIAPECVDGIPNMNAWTVLIRAGTYFESMGIKKAINWKNTSSSHKHSMGLFWFFLNLKKSHCGHLSALSGLRPARRKYSKKCLEKTKMQFRPWQHWLTPGLKVDCFLIELSATWRPHLINYLAGNWLIDWLIKINITICISSQMIFWGCLIQINFLWSWLN